MKKLFHYFDDGTASYVILHGKYMAKRGRRPSMAYKGERNPRLALEAAKKDLLNDGIFIVRVDMPPSVIFAVVAHLSPYGCEIDKIMAPVQTWRDFHAAGFTIPEEEGVLKCNDVYPGLQVNVVKLKTTTGYHVLDKYLSVRRLENNCVVYGYVPGHGGDVHFVQHPNGDIGAYTFNELGPVTAQ